MKVIPKKINSFVVTSTDTDAMLTINESFNVNYIKTDISNDDIIQDLVEGKAYATSLLYLNESYKLNLDKSDIAEDKVSDFYNDCSELLSTHTMIVEEKGIPLVSINGYNIYESDIGILRGNGKKKLKESFDDENAYYRYWDEQIDELLKLNPTDDQLAKLVDEMAFDDNITHSQYTELYNKIQNWIVDTSPLKNESEGTQVGDIAPKVDQDMNGKPKKDDKKYYDILLSGLDESMDSILNKGFVKNIQGQYERDGYILIKENDKFIAVRKEKIIKD